MGNRSKSLFILASFLAIILVLPAQAKAYNRQLTVYASVLPFRVIYVDKYGNLIRVAGNTADNIAPRVFDAYNKPVALSETVKLQYDQLLKQNSGHLLAGMVYEFNPILVVTSTTLPALQINTTGLMPEFGQNG